MNIRRLQLAALPALACLAISPLTHAADTPTKEDEDKTKDQGHMMMDHSPADTKAMSKMKDKKIPIHHAGDAPTATTDGKPKEHIMMDHSPADTKAMSKMKNKKPHIHKDGDPTTAGTTKKGEQHMMMDHSPADTKAMSKMKNKKIPIHTSGDGTTDSASEKPGESK